MNKILCVYCNKEVLKSNIRTHQKTKSCREKQLDSGVSPKEKHQRSETEFQALKSELMEVREKLAELDENNRNLVVDISVAQTEIMGLRNEIEIYKSFYGKLEEKKDEDDKLIRQLASKPTVTNTTRNTQNNNNHIFQQLVPLDLSVEQILALGEVTLEQFQQGAKGAVEWMRPMLTDNNGNFKLHITDKNRGRLEFKNLDGTKETDVNCEKIMETVKPLLEPQLLKLKKSLDLVVIDQYAYDEEANQVGGLVSRKIKETKTLKANFMDNKLVFKELQKQKA
jgi:hypothetical protein